MNTPGAIHTPREFAEVLCVSFALIATAVFTTHPIVSASAAICTLVYAFFSIERLRVDGDYWGHLLPGAAMVRISFMVLFGDGGALVTTSWVTPALGACTFAAIGLIQWFDIGARTFSHKVHLLIYILCFLYTLSAAIGTCAHVNTASRREAHALTPAGLATLSPRIVLDCFILTSLGLLFAAHRHTQGAVQVTHHVVLAVMLLSLGPMQLIAAAVHLVLPRNAPLSVLSRSLHALNWLVLGVWLCQMSALFYVFRVKEGLWTARLVPTVGDDARATEEALTYLAFDLVMCAAAVSLMQHVSTPKRDGFERLPG